MARSAGARPPTRRGGRCTRRCAGSRPRAAYAHAEGAWALDVFAGIIRSAGDERLTGDAPGARGEP